MRAVSSFPTMKTLVSDLALLAGRFGLRDIYVFGSRAEEIAARSEGRVSSEDAGASDADIAVEPLPGSRLDAHERVRLAQELEDLLGVPRVDLVVLSEARPILALDVVRGALLYTSDPLAQAEQELYILRRAGDLLPLQRDRVKEVLTGGAR